MKNKVDIILHYFFHYFHYYFHHCFHYIFLYFSDESSSFFNMFVIFQYFFISFHYFSLFFSHCFSLFFFFFLLFFIISGEHQATSGSSPHLDIYGYPRIWKDIHGYERILLGYILVILDIFLDLSKKDIHWRYPWDIQTYPWHIQPTYPWEISMDTYPDISLNIHQYPNEISTQDVLWSLAALSTFQYICNLVRTEPAYRKRYKLSAEIRFRKWNKMNVLPRRFLWEWRHGNAMERASEGSLTRFGRLVTSSPLHSKGTIGNPSLDCSKPIVLCCKYVSNQCVPASSQLCFWVFTWKGQLPAVNLCTLWIFHTDFFACVRWQHHSSGKHIDVSIDFFTCVRSLIGLMCNPPKIIFLFY